MNVFALRKTKRGDEDDESVYQMIVKNEKEEQKEGDKQGERKKKKRKRMLPGSGRRKDANTPESFPLTAT